MKVLRLKLFQETACYKKPLAFKVGETYPLPPYATVKGWAHALLSADQLIPMRVSVQGGYEAKIMDIRLITCSKNGMWMSSPWCWMVWGERLTLTKI